jgi:hypothetical protein
VSVTLKIYDSSGLLVQSLSTGSAGSALTAVAISSNPYNPGTGSLLLSDGGWTYSFDGRDSTGAVLRNGIYLFVVASQEGGKQIGSVEFQVTVLGNGGAGVTLLVAPNPVHSSAEYVSIQWQPAGQVVELKIYDLPRGLVRGLGTCSSPAVWDLRTGGGEKVGDGIYIVSARVPGQRKPTLFKLMVAR